MDEHASGVQSILKKYPWINDVKEKKRREEALNWKLNSDYIVPGAPAALEAYRRCDWNVKKDWGPAWCWGMRTTGRARYMLSGGDLHGYQSCWLMCYDGNIRKVYVPEFLLETLIEQAPGLEAIEPGTQFAFRWENVASETGIYTIAKVGPLVPPDELRYRKVKKKKKMRGGGNVRRRQKAKAFAIKKQRKQRKS